MTDNNKRWPETIPFGMFSKKKGTHDYKKAMAKKRIEDGEFKELKGPGGWDGGSAYHFKPRYSSYRPFETEDSSRCDSAVSAEKTARGRMLDGLLGQEAKERALREGLGGIFERIDLHPDGLTVVDLLNRDEPPFLRPVPGRDMSGLWELTDDFENEDADRRTKNDWRLEPIWKKGTRFVLARNEMGYRIIADQKKTIISVLEEEEDDKHLEKIEALKAELEDEDTIWADAGYVIHKCDAQHQWEKPLSNIAQCKRFKSLLKPVPIMKTQDAFDYARTQEYHIRDVLEYLVKDGKLQAWQLANLLHQASEGLGYFEEVTDG